MALQLRPYEPHDEAAAVAIHQAMLLDDFHFLLGYDTAMAWPTFLQSIEDQRRGLDLSEFRVIGTQLVAEVDGELVGRASLRFVLNDFFASVGGHVGYGVAPAHHGKGYGTEILRQALIVLRHEGVERVLVTCFDVNVASAIVIERNGGVLESIVPSENNGALLRRYWIG